MDRLVRLQDADRSFDLEFWDRIGPEGRLKAMWEMVLDAIRLRGGGDLEPGLQRTAERVERR
jgi:hypothetical protein